MTTRAPLCLIEMTAPQPAVHLVDPLRLMGLQVIRHTPIRFTGLYAAARHEAAFFAFVYAQISPVGYRLVSGLPLPKI